MSGVKDRVLQLAKECSDEAERRRGISAHDMSADYLAHFAGKLRAIVSDTTAGSDDDDLTVTEYAALKNKGVSTVREWCRKGLIGRKEGRDYLIRRGEPVPDLARTRAHERMTEHDDESANAA